MHFLFFLHFCVNSLTTILQKKNSWKNSEFVFHVYIRWAELNEISEEVCLNFCDDNFGQKYKLEQHSYKQRKEICENYNLQLLTCSLHDFTKYEFRISQIVTPIRKSCFCFFIKTRLIDVTITTDRVFACLFDIILLSKLLICLTLCKNSELVLCHSKYIRTVGS